MPLSELEPISKRLHETLRAAIQNHAMLEAANNDKELIRLFDETLEAHGFAAIRNALIQTLLMEVIRCWDGHRDDRASLPSLCKRLSKPGVSEAAIEAAAGWNPGMRLEDRNRETVKRTLAELQAGVKALTKDEAEARLRRIRDFRHTFVAHNLTKEPASLPQYRDLFGLLDDTLPLVKKAALAILGHDVDYEEERSAMESRARDFWASVYLGQKETRERAVRRRDELNRRLKDDR